MSSLRVCFLIFFMINLLAAQTVIEDGAHVSGTWTLSGSPYLIRGEAIVDEDSLLQIEPGVEIRFKTGSQSDYLDPAFDLAFLRIDGKLTAQGSADQPIVFTRDGADGNWGILFFDQTADSSSTLKFYRIEYASHILHLLDWLEYSGAVSVNGTQVTLEQCRVSRNAKDGLFAHNGSFRVTNSLIARNGANGLVAASDARLQVSNVTLTGNSENGIAMGLNSSLSVTNSIFWNNGG
ncbi:MAG TPA: right-handed parallel beta-helix repeat-containing protein, partial [Caldithrix abyssi]|nr:right-handed parallel beta-helix repeat-containing protein [Caldithrix abyssi]